MMKRVLRQTWRGIGWLPIVGDHPGLPALLFFWLLSVFMGISSGSFLAAIGFLGLPVTIFFLSGAYSRAEDSDAMVTRELRREE